MNDTDPADSTPEADVRHTANAKAKADSEAGAIVPWASSAAALNAFEKGPGTEKIRRLHDALSEETIIEVEGRPVRLTLLLSGELQATMVQPGRFPISNTGFRSIMHGLRSRYLVGLDSSENPETGGTKPEEASEHAAGEEEVYKTGKAALDDLTGESKPLSETVIRSCQDSLPAPKDDPIRAITEGTVPSRKKLANTILTAAREKRPEIIEAGIRQYQQTVRLPEPDPCRFEHRRHWSAALYRKKLKTAEGTLQMLREARQKGLFSGNQDLSMALEVASTPVCATYLRAGYSCEVTYNWTLESCHRRYLRLENNSRALTGGKLWGLAKRLLASDAPLRFVDE